MDRKSFDEIPRWNDVLKDLEFESLEEERSKELKQRVLVERSKLPWSFRESSFWLGAVALRLYDEIEKAYLKAHGREETVKLLSKLNYAMDYWDDFITERLSQFRNSRKFEEWRDYLLRREEHRCRKCGTMENLLARHIISLSELMATYVRENCCDIYSVDVESSPYFYQKSNGLVLCPDCGFNEWQDYDSEVDYYQMLIADSCTEPMLVAGEYIEPACVVDSFIKRKRNVIQLFEPGESNEIWDKLRDTRFTSKDWFLGKLSKIERLEKKWAYYWRGPGEGHQFLKVQISLRAGEYSTAKRWAMRLDKYRRRQLDERRVRDLVEKRKSFAERNSDAILGRTLDKIIDLHRKGDYSITYTWVYAQDGAERFRALFREAENEIRTEMGVPLIGEGWITETEVFQLVKRILPQYEVIHHARPRWLEGQEFDIYIPEARLAVEYMGEQHYKPIDYFGGEQGFSGTKERDQRKRKRAQERGIRILYVRFDDRIEENVLRERLSSFVSEL